ncbi:MAG TPA: Fe-S protein assembly co-chaperone HscB [Polyangia bacterium]|jgi:molecular chaperone HscB|nr:Fe-S protein assembly co-chaperone HscB [Polyangia bacterium]
MARDHFEVLGLPRAYHLDAADLESRYLALQKETHPDRFAKAMPRERMEAVVRNTELNDAYRVLKNDIKRAEYLLKLEGVDIGEEKPQSTTGATKQLVVDPKLLIEIMELREALADAHSDEDEAKVALLARDVMERRAVAMKLVDEGFTAYETGSKQVLDAIARALVSLRYYGRFMDEVEGKE